MKYLPKGSCNESLEVEVGAEVPLAGRVKVPCCSIDGLVNNTDNIDSFTNLLTKIS